MRTLAQTDINLRGELFDLIKTNDMGDAKFNILVLRQIRRDSSLGMIRCSCYNVQSQEGTLGCPSCGGVGHLWDEKIVKGYMYREQYMKLIDNQSLTRPIGRNNTDAYILYTEPEVIVRAGDYVFLLDATVEGAVKHPMLRTSKMRCIYNKEMRLDHNRLEYNQALVEVQ